MVTVLVADYAAWYVQMVPIKTLLQDAPSLFSPIDAWVAGVAPTIGFEEDKVRFLLCMCFSLLAAVLHRELPDSPSLKHLYSTCLGLLFACFSFRAEAMHSLITAIVTYGIVCVFGARSFGPVLALAFNLFYMFACHLHQQLSNWGSYTLDFTAIQMMLTIKLTMFAYNVYDRSRGSKASKTQQQWSCQLPSMLEFLGFCYFFGGLLAGPAFEFVDYIAFTNLSLYNDSSRPSRGALLAASCKKLAIAAIMGGLLVAAGSYSPHWAVCAYGDNSCDATGGVSAGFLALPLWARIGYMWLSVSLCRPSYYFAWTLADAACTLCGLAYNGVSEDGRPKFDRVTNCDVLDFEFGQSFRTVLAGWNKGTNRWLRHYVYERLVDAGYNRGLATHGTFILSAFWHGFYPGYYITFLFGSVITNIARDLRTWLRPIFVDDSGKTPLWYNAAGMLGCSFAVNMACIAFVILDLPRSMAIFKSLYFLPYVLIAAVYFIANRQAVAAARAKKKAAQADKKTE